LYQYYCGLGNDKSCGINPPQFFGSGEAAQECVAKALIDSKSGVVQWNTFFDLANCHKLGWDPSPQVNIIVGPDIPVAGVNPWTDLHKPDMCVSHTESAWHFAFPNHPNIAVFSLSHGCTPDLQTFTRLVTHEVVEIVSDPARAGYWDKNSLAEAADFCQDFG